MPRPRKKPIEVQHADLDATRWQQHRARKRISEEFEAREAARGRGTAKSAESPERRTPTFDRDVRRLIDRGFSEELAREMARAMVPHDVRSRWGGDQI